MTDLTSNNNTADNNTPNNSNSNDNPSGDVETPSMTSAPAGRYLLIASLLLCLIALGVSVHLTKIHFLVHTDPTYHSICAVNEGMNCEKVAQSAYSVFLGLPISVWGILAYTMMSVLYLWGIVRPLNKSWPRGILLLLTGMSFMASGALAYISFFLIKSMCIFCMSLYVLNTLLFALAIGFVVRGPKNPVVAFLADFKEVLRRPATFGGLILAAVLVLSGLQLGLPKYWVHLSWEDLPVLKSGVDENGDHWLGAENPVLTVVEYSDYECPHCRRKHKETRAMLAEYSDEIRFIHKHYPIDSNCNSAIKTPFHQRACEFSVAVECAAEQKKFWQMNDAIFAGQSVLRADEVDLSQLAKDLKLDTTMFADCLADKKGLKKIKTDILMGQQKKIKGTPTFYIGDESFPGGIPEHVLYSRLKKAKASKK